MTVSDANWQARSDAIPRCFRQPSNAFQRLPTTLPTNPPYTPRALEHALGRRNARLGSCALTGQLTIACRKPARRIGERETISNTRKGEPHGPTM